VKRYSAAAAAHLLKANRELTTALAHLPARPDPDKPPTRAQGDSATIFAFHARDPNTILSLDDIVLAGRTMTNCFDSNVVYVVSSIDLVAGSVLTQEWRLPNGRSTGSEQARGPYADNLIGGVNYVNYSPLPNGVYTYELRTQRKVLAKAKFTRRCA
jgi:hypothetical protein